MLAQIGGQCVDNTVDSFDGTSRVQGAQHEVAGFGGRHGHGDGLGIAQLAHKDDIRVLAHGGANAVGERRQMRTQFTLYDLALLAGVYEFNRIFEADDIEVTGFVQMINHRGQRR